MKRSMAIPIPLAVLALAALAPALSLSRPVNPAKGWILELDSAVGSQDMNLAETPYYLEKTGAAETVVTLSSLGMKYSGISQGAAWSLLGLGYSWPRLSLEILTGGKNLALEWKSLNAATGDRIATYTAAADGGADLILSWNFRHIVNFDRIRGFNSVNVRWGYRAMTILSPREIGDADESQSV